MAEDSILFPAKTLRTWSCDRRHRPRRYCA
jgi:hypothetical protein